MYRQSNGRCDEQAKFGNLSPRMLSDWLRHNIRCPADKLELSESSAELVCSAGHRFQIVNDVPVLLLQGVAQTFHVTDKSLNAARTRTSAHSIESLFLDTVGIDPQQRRAIE